MSAAADPRAPNLPPAWARLERAGEDAAVALIGWRRRALEAEAEVVRLRRALEGLTSEHEHPGDTREEARRLRAENAALRSRLAQARQRVHSLLARLSALEAGW